jgi:hypothetical protein
VSPLGILRTGLHRCVSRHFEELTCRMRKRQSDTSLRKSSGMASRRKSTFTLCRSMSSLQKLEAAASSPRYPILTNAVGETKPKCRSPNWRPEYRHSIRYFGLLAPSAKGNKWAGLFVTLSQEMKTPPPRLNWRDSLVRCFGFDPLLDSRGQEIRWVRRERPAQVT